MTATNDLQLFDTQTAYVLAQRMRRIAGAQAAFWLEHGPDHECGGFHGQLDRRELPTGNGKKGLIQQARHLWSLSTWYEVSYGHDMETSWLALEAMRVLHTKRVAAPLPERIGQDALEMGKASAVAGFDADIGGYFYAGIPSVGVIDREKVYWVQFEALPALAQLHQAGMLPDALHRLTRTLDWELL